MVRVHQVSFFLFYQYKIMIHLFSLGCFIASFCRLFAGYVYTEPPEDFAPKMEVSGCYCKYHGKLLLMQRNPQKPQGGTWCVPGGKLEKGETPLDAVIREVNEECGIQLCKENLRYCRKVFVRFPENDFVLHLFKAKLSAAPGILRIALKEHSDYRWVTLDEAVQMNLIPGGKENLYLQYPKLKIKKVLSRKKDDHLRTSIMVPVS